MRTRLPGSPLEHTAFARSLRRAPTEAENRLWYYLRDRRLSGAKFRRQVPIGPYVVDFLCVTASLIVEADGGQHSERAGYDEERTRYLEARGYRVVRFWNNDVIGNIEGVMQAIAMALTPDPSPASGRGEQKSPFSLGRRVGDEGIDCE
ncbi:MAG: endonuclease domain-containing protein, partial [Betaproteobacteria bacterium]|nr:endonuclease domain-containing protein [Betaproteobacteria bacterium]